VWRDPASSSSFGFRPRSTLQEGPGALIVGGAHGSLAIARSLGRRGIPVMLVTDDHPIAGFSRYTHASIAWDGPQRDGAADALIELARRRGCQGWVLFAGGDPEVQFIARAHARLSTAFRLTTPPWELVRRAQDKRLMQDLAASAGIDCAWTCYPCGVQDLAGLACRFPLILKPTLREERNDFTSAKAWRVDDRYGLIDAYARAAALVGADRIMLQELIPGTGAAQFSCAGVFDHGSPLMSLVARRTRQFPVDFGVTSTFVETVANREVEDAAFRLLQSLGYTGLAEVEFKYDSRDGRYKILDVNARAWTWLALGEAAGVDFAFAAWRLALGERMVGGRGRTGVTWRHAMRDLVAALQEMRRGTLRPRDFARSWRPPAAFAAYAADDPLPGLLELPVVVSRVAARRLRRLGRAIRWCASRWFPGSGNRAWRQASGP
jgi:predicted ATP-grasp superfamily ATP-dependent carboligase